MLYFPQFLITNCLHYLSIVHHTGIAQQGRSDFRQLYRPLQFPQHEHKTLVPSMPLKHLDLSSTQVRGNCLLLSTPTLEYQANLAEGSKIVSIQS